MKLAVTGGSGSVGRLFTARALSEGHLVRVLTRRPAHPIADVEVVQGSIADGGARKALLRGMDVLVHLAAYGVDPRSCSWTEAIEANIAGAVALLLDAAASLASHSVFAGSANEYEGFGILPSQRWYDTAAKCPETARLGARGPYGASKAASSILLRAVAHETRHASWYLRFSGLFGLPGARQGVFSSALSSARAGSVFRSTLGEQVRDWLSVDDAVSALMAACERRPGEPGCVCNIGSGTGVTLEEILTEVIQYAGKHRGATWERDLPYREREPHVLVLDVEKARGVLGFSASADWKIGLRSWIDKEGVNTDRALAPSSM